MPESRRETAASSEPASDVEVLPRALLGAVFPLRPRELTLLARENDAPALLLTRLSALRTRDYRSVADVEKGLLGAA